MSMTAFVFVVIGVGTATNWLFRLVDKLEGER